MTRGRRARIAENWANKVHWPISKNNVLEPCKHTKKIVPLISKEGLELFRGNVNRIIFTTLDATAPIYLRFGVQVVALFIAIIGVICLTLSYFVVGAVVFILAFMLAGLGFWYREQLIRRAWKKIGQSMAKEFKAMGDKFPGISYEFHVQGRHRMKQTKREKEKNKKGRRRTVFYERYIVIYLPGDASHFHEFAEDRRTVSAVLKNKSQPVRNQANIIGDKPLILPYWWAKGKSKSGEIYYINNLKHTTQWKPPTEEQVEMEKEELNEILAPPEDDEEDSSDSSSE